MTPASTSSRQDFLKVKSRRRAHQPSTWLFILVMLLGAWMRIEATLHTQVDKPIRNDALEYFSYAYNLQHYHVYSRTPSFIDTETIRTVTPDSLRPPGYAAFLVPFAAEIPGNKTVLQITLIQALLGVAIVGMTFLLARRLLSANWALLPTGLVAISPQLINAGVYVLTESLFTFFLLYGVLCLVQQFERPKAIWPMWVAGALLGAAALTRPTLNYVVPFFLLAFSSVIGKEHRRQWAVALLVGFLVVTAPWALRNLLQFGGSDPLLAINALVHGHYPGAMYQGNPASLGYPYRFDPHVAQLSSSIGAAITGIWARVEADPVTYAVWYLVGKPLMLFSWGDVSGNGDIFTYPTLASPYYGHPVFVATKSMMEHTHALWVLLAAAAVVALCGRRKQMSSSAAGLGLWLLAALFIYFVLIHAVGFPLSRYCVPLYPVIFVLATWSLIQASRYLANSSLVSRRLSAGDASGGVTR